MLEAALFCQKPEIGTSDYTNEVKYVGYKRVMMVSDGRTNVTPVLFPPSDQDMPTLVTHIAAIDQHGTIVAVNSI